MQGTTIECNYCTPCIQMHRCDVYGTHLLLLWNRNYTYTVRCATIHPLRESLKIDLNIFRKVLHVQYLQYIYVIISIESFFTLHLSIPTLTQGKNLSIQEGHAGNGRKKTFHFSPYLSVCALPMKYCTCSDSSTCKAVTVIDLYSMCQSMLCHFQTLHPSQGVIVYNRLTTHWYLVTSHFTPCKFAPKWKLFCPQISTSSSDSTNWHQVPLS